MQQLFWVQIHRYLVTIQLAVCFSQICKKSLIRIANIPLSCCNSLVPMDFISRYLYRISEVNNRSVEFMYLSSKQGINCSFSVWRHSLVQHQQAFVGQNNICRKAMDEQSSHWLFTQYTIKINLVLPNLIFRNTLLFRELFGDSCGGCQFVLASSPETLLTTTQN